MNKIPRTVREHHEHLSPNKQSELEQGLEQEAHLELAGRCPSLQWCRCFKRACQ